MGAIRAIKLEKLFKLYATFSVAFLLSYAISGVVSPISNSSAVTCEDGMVFGTDDVCGTDNTDVNVSIEGSWTVSISSAGTLGVNITPTSSGVVNTAVDNVNIYTNTPNGYQLYLNSTTGSTDIYNNSDTQQERNHFTATTGTKASPVSLTSNSWGYSLASSPTTFSKVETSSSAVDALISTGSKTSGSGDNLDVTYGFNADTKLTPGTYTTSVTYTAVAEVPSYTISSISPLGSAYNTSTTEVTILTSTPSSELGLGNVTASIGTVNLTNCSETIVNGYRGATCTYSGGLSAGRYNVSLTSSWHNATYTLNNAFTINSMQEFTSTNCTNLPESTTTIDNRIDLVDSRDGKTYKVSKLADGNCWMVSNLALDGGRTITPEDSNVTQEVVLPANIPDGTASSRNISQIYSIHANDLDSYGNKKGNLYNFMAASNGIYVTSSDDITIYESICPKNWKLPDEYTTLMGAYSLPTTHGVNEAAVKKMQQPPLYFTTAGIYLNTYDSTQLGLQTRTARQDVSEVLTYSTNSYMFYPYVPNGSFVAYSVRCVFGS